MSNTDMKIGSNKDVNKVRKELTPGEPNREQDTAFKIDKPVKITLTPSIGRQSTKKFLPKSIMMRN